MYLLLVVDSNLPPDETKRGKTTKEKYRKGKEKEKKEKNRRLIILFYKKKNATASVYVRNSQSTSISFRLVRLRASVGNLRHAGECDSRLGVRKEEKIGWKGG